MNLVFLLNTFFSMNLYIIRVFFNMHHQENLLSYMVTGTVYIKSNWPKCLVRIKVLLARTEMYSCLASWLMLMSGLMVHSYWSTGQNGESHFDADITKIHLMNGDTRTAVIPQPAPPHSNMGPRLQEVPLHVYSPTSNIIISHIKTTADEIIIL